MQQNNGEIFVKVVGSGSFLPGMPIPADEVDHYLGELTAAPDKIRKWLKRMRLLMKELLEVEYYHFALDPITREFTEDNVTMSVKASLEAISDAGLIPENIDLIVYGSTHQDQRCRLQAFASRKHWVLQNVLKFLSMPTVLQLIRRC
ncbi:MAG: hypothetical protein NTW16_07825 [Bacteroidetes bacterium]|nr:hypothetical protein [Bacteroidota bacterium]